MASCLVSNGIRSFQSFQVAMLQIQCQTGISTKQKITGKKCRRSSQESKIVDLVVGAKQSTGTSVQLTVVEDVPEQ